MTKPNLNLHELLHGGDYNPDQWIDHPEIIDQDFKLMKEAQVNTVTVGVFSWAALEPTEGHYNFTWLDNIFDRVEAQQGHIILATPSGAKPRWLAEKYPEVLRTDENGQHLIYGGRHNHCFTSPIYREKIQKINRLLAERYGHRSSLILWHISNELGGECHCELCQIAFRNWLQQKYQTLAALNAAWWTTFWGHQITDWQQVHSPSPLGDTNLKGLNLDWRRFVTDQTIDYFEDEVKPLRELTPNIPITTNFMTDTPDMIPFHGLDYHKFAEHLDVISWDSYPAWANDYESTADLAMKVALINDYYRSLKDKNFLIMESSPSRVNWHPYNRAKRPGMHQLASLQNIAGGSESMLYFQWRQSRGASEMFHGSVIEHRGDDQTRTFKEVAQVGQDLANLQELVGSQPISAQVAIIFDFDNMCALNDAEAYSQETKKYWQTIQQQYAYFWRHDIPVDVIAPESDLTKYQLVIDPMHFMMSTKFADKLAAYVKNGGHLVGTYISGVVDESVLAYLNDDPQSFQKVYGLKPVETDVLYPGQRNTIMWGDKSYQIRDYAERLQRTTAQELASYQTDFYQGSSAITKNDYGAGQAYYLACRTEQKFLNQFYDYLTHLLKLLPNKPIIKNSSDISIQIRQKQQTQYIFVMNFSDQVKVIQLTEKLPDLLTANQISAGNYELAPYQVLVLKK